MKRIAFKILMSVCSLFISILSLISGLYILEPYIKVNDISALGVCLVCYGGYFFAVFICYSSIIMCEKLEEK
jgi:threonine/homoserine efflux transporter RhtA